MPCLGPIYYTYEILHLLSFNTNHFGIWTIEPKKFIFIFSFQWLCENFKRSHLTMKCHFECCLLRIPLLSSFMFWLLRKCWYMYFIFLFSVRITKGKKNIQIWRLQPRKIIKSFENSFPIPENFYLLEVCGRSLFSILGYMKIVYRILLPY